MSLHMSWPVGHHHAPRPNFFERWQARSREKTLNRARIAGRRYVETSIELDQLDKKYPNGGETWYAAKLAIEQQQQALREQLAGHARKLNLNFAALCAL